MRKSTCITFIKAMLMEIHEGYGEQKWKNPETLFNLNAGNGKYNEMTDADFCIIQKDAKEISRLWHNRRDISASDLFVRFIESLDIDNSSIDDIAKFLTGYCEKSFGKFLPELEHPELLKNPHAGRPLRQSHMDSPKCKNLHVFLPNGTFSAGSILTDPKQIYDYMTTHIYGQKEACRAATMLLYNHVRGKQRNILFVGPTGCGKTEIWRICSNLYPNIIIVDADSITAEGWAGSFKIRDIFTDMTKSQIERSIVVFDEFDKLCEPQFGNNGTNHSYTNQNNLLKLIEGSVMRFPADRDKPAITFDSSKISFVFLGSFEHLTEMKTQKEVHTSIGFGTTVEKPDADNIYTQQITQNDLKYSGMRREIAGRINQIVQLAPMTMQDYETILENDILSPIYRLEQEYGVTIHISEETRKGLAKEAADNRMGVRYLQSRVQSMLDDCIFEDCSQSEYVLDANNPHESNDQKQQSGKIYSEKSS